MLRSAQFVDRYDAGRRLGAALRAHVNGRPLIVLGLPRGGMPVASCVAEALEAPLDTFVVRKLGVPGYEEVALGAIASGDVRVLNQDIVEALRIPPHVIDHVAAREQRELERREAMYRGGERFPDLSDTVVIVVDDGAATGASMRVAITALRQLGPRSIVAAVPVASRTAFKALASAADSCECLVTPEPFYGVGLWYQDFSETSDAEVRGLLADARRRVGRNEDGAVKRSASHHSKVGV
jgi:predicted phosphoribosyltransferase